MNLRTALELIGVIIAAISLIIGIISLYNDYFNSSDKLPEDKGANIINNTVINNNVVVIPSNSPKESTIYPESSATDQYSEEIIEAPPKEQFPNEDPSATDSNIESSKESESNIRSSQARQPSTTSQTTADNSESRGIDDYEIGDYVPGRGYYMTNEYEKNSLLPDCSIRSVANYCTSPDCCVSCLGECSLPGTRTDRNGVTYTCSNGKWTIS